MANFPKVSTEGISRSELIHSARMATAALVSLLFARFFRLPEEYWAAITTLIVMQSTLGAAFMISRQRLLGTALGACAGAILAMYSRPGAIVFSFGILVLGVICAVPHLSRSTYRFAGITLAIVLLVPRTQSAWVVAAHRFLEIAIGIAVGLLLTAIWPEAEPAVS